eukprot:scaffold326059_cov63-Tisochrysis_lutea.AAC.2
MGDAVRMPGRATAHAALVHSLQRRHQGLLLHIEQRDDGARIAAYVVRWMRTKRRMRSSPCSAPGMASHAFISEGQRRRQAPAVVRKSVVLQQL